MEPAIPGTLLAERYLLVKPLGSGGSATVWEAMDTSLHRAVAVKLLRGSAVNDPTERERLRREARVLARLAHPRICAIWDYIEAPLPDGTGLPVLVTELLTGQSLSQRLARGPLPWPEAVAVCAQIADALLAAHQAGVVHRDVKPANVILVDSGAKLLDFGIARAANDGDLTGNLTVGTPLCMAPEQVRGQRARPASDIYALGCVLYWTLTGRPPYQSKDVTEIFEAQLYDPPPNIDVPGLPARVVEFCHGCLSKNPALRPNASQAVAILSSFTEQFRDLGLRQLAAPEPRPQLTAPSWTAPTPVPPAAAASASAPTAAPPRTPRAKPRSKGKSAKPAPAGPASAGRGTGSGTGGAAGAGAGAGAGAAAGAGLGAVARPRPERGAFDSLQPTHQLAEATAQWDPPDIPPPPGNRTVLSQVLDEQDQDSGPRLRPRIADSPPPGYRDPARSPRPAVLIAASLAGALAVGAAAVLLINGHSSAAPSASSSNNAPALPGTSRNAVPGPSVSTLNGAGTPTISATPAADPIGYLEAVRGQIRTFVSQGPMTLDATTGGDLQNSIIDIENSVRSAQQNGGAAHIQEIRNKISEFDGRLNGLVGKGRVSAAAASELTVEVQRLSNTVTD